MKNLLYILSFVLLTAQFSCSDNNNPIDTTSTTDKVNVLLKISNLSDKSFVRSTGEAKANLSKIIYAIYLKENNTVEGEEKMILRDSIDLINNNTSLLNLNLDPGKYIVAVYATGRSNAKMRGNIGDMFNNSSLRIDDMTSFSEFYGIIDIEVFKESISKEITLDRIVGKVEIVAKDLTNVRADVSSAMPILRTYTINSNWLDIFPSYMTMHDKNSGFGIGYQDGSPFKDLKLERASFTQHSEDNPIEFYCLQTVSEFGINNFKYSVPSLYLKLNSESPIGSDMILITKKMEVHPNKITRYTGTIIGNNEQGFSFSIENVEWEDNPDITEIEQII